MNLLLPALHELARIYDRQVNRAALWMARRKLASAETHLGLLGWHRKERGWQLRELTRSRHSLEDIFVAVTRSNPDEEVL